MKKKIEDELKITEENVEDEEIVEVDLLDVLLDENNTSPIYMLDNKGNRLKFEQIAVIPYGEDELYCMLKPITKIEGFKGNEAAFFEVVEQEDGKSVLKVVVDRILNLKLYNQYLILMKEQRTGKK